MSTPTRSPAPSSPELERLRSGPAGDTPGTESPEDLAGRVQAQLEATIAAMSPDEIGDPREFRHALGMMLQATTRAARRRDRDPSRPLSPGDNQALEAVIRADGTRPTLLVRDDVVDAAHPLAGVWTDTFTATSAAMRDRCRAVGRIEPVNATASSFFGTGWVVDADAGLVLTNLHVVEAMWQRLSHLMPRTPRGFRVLDGAYINFAGESGRARSDRFRIVEATGSGIDGRGFRRLDAAVLKIEPTTDGQQFPPAIPVVADPDAPLGNLASFCVVGFPGPPAFTGGIHEGVDWNWVNTTLFGNRFGVKRLAPGNAHRPLGSLAGDERGWVFGHDLTTLGGSSGSPLIGWLDAEPAAFGLHFAGASLDTNCAHAVVACAEQLHAMGVPVR